MKIKNVCIKNFRALKDVSIPFESITTFIGPNGVGKSTVLRALDWFFNGKPGALHLQDCSFGRSEDIEVEVTFADLTPKDREALGKYAPEGTETFTVWKSRSTDGSELTSANAKSFPAFDEIKSATGAQVKKDLYAKLRDERRDLDLPPASTAMAVDQAMTAWETANRNLLVEAPETLQTNFFGFNSGGKLSGLFDFVLVTADLRASEESTDAKSSIVGRILERSIDRSAADDEIAKIVEESRLKQQQLYEEKFQEQLTNITTQLNAVIGSYSPGREISVSPSNVELKAPKTTFEVNVLDGVTQTSVDRQGHGFQRTILISALQLLAQSGSASDEGVICLAIEEPELFQHPIQALTFAKVLRSLAEDRQKNIQITYATHSPCFVEPRHFDQIRRMTRTQEEPPTVAVHMASLGDVKKKLDGITKGSVVEAQLDGLVANQLSVALFANRAFLVEGSTEASIFHGIADKVSPGSLEASGTAVVAVGGKSSIPLAHAVLESLGIPVFALFDADGGFEVRAVANGKASDKIAEERQSHIAANRSLLRYFGQPAQDFPEEMVTEDLAILADHLEGFLVSNWPEWVAACESIEKEFGIRLAKNQAAYRAATLRAEGATPSTLEEILERARQKK